MADPEVHTNYEENSVTPEWFTADCEYHDIPTGMVWHGRDELQQMQDETDEAMGTELVTRFLERIETDQVNVTWYEWSGTYVRDYANHEVKGKPFTIQGLTVAIKDEQGKIVKQIDSWDLAGQLAQLGVIPSFADIRAGKA